MIGSVTRRVGQGRVAEKERVGILKDLQSLVTPPFCPSVGKPYLEDK